MSRPIDPFAKNPPRPPATDGQAQDDVTAENVRLRAELAELRETVRNLLWTLDNKRSTLLGKSAAENVDRLRQLIEEKE